MATKTSKLHTTFTGDDKQFQRVAGKVVKSGTQMGTMASKLKGAFAAMGGAFVIKGIVEQFDRIGKVAKRVGMTAEEVQRLAHASKLAGTSFETLQAILTRLQRRIGEALQNPASAAAQAFEELGLSAAELSGMGLKEQFFAVADAFKATGGSVGGVASLMKLLDTEARNLIPLFQEGATGIQTMMDGATVATNATVKAMEGVSDKMTEIKNKAEAGIANVLVDAFDVVEKKAAGVSAGLLILLNALGLGSGLSAKDIGTAYAQELGWFDAAEKEKAEKAKAEKEKDKKASWEKEQKERDRRGMENLKLTAPIFQGRIEKAFAAVGEVPFKETIEEFDKKWGFHEAPGLKDVKEEEKAAAVSGKFGEFLQTAGLGGTSYIRKTPAVVQLEKQTKLSEKMAKSLDDFNASLDDLVGNTVER